MRYLAYGSNIDDRNMAEFSETAQPLGPGRLGGYRLEFNVYSDRWGGGAANIEPDEDGHVWGLVWAVEPEDVERLDTYEGHPTFYRREEVRVALGDEITTCVTYRVAHQSGFVRPSDQYLNMVRSAMRVHGLPPEALDMLEAAARPPKPRIST